MRQPARIHVLGASGTATSTFGRFVANKLQLPFLETDAFYLDADRSAIPGEARDS